MVEQSRQEISAELLNAYRNFTNQKATLKLEEENIEYAREILKVAQEKFRIGASSLVEVKMLNRHLKQPICVWFQPATIPKYLKHYFEDSMVI